MAIPFERLEGKYEVIEKIREGGMGSVYKVRHRLLDEVRVIKVMRPHLADDEVLRARFLREAKVAIKLRQRNLAQIYDFTMDDSGYAFLVMEFIDGLNLQEVGKVLAPPPIGLVLEIAKQTLDALGYLHRKKIIHRDVSPDNLLVTRDEEGEVLVKLIDLGIAKVHGGDENLTSAGTFLGKVRYSSPEHFRTQESNDVDASSDLYSFGVVMYELLTGCYPIKGTSVSSLIAGHLMHPPMAFAESDPDGHVPEELRAVVMQALEKKPEDRYGSAASFRKALEPLRAEYPVDEQSMAAIFEAPTVTTRKLTVQKPGSTQSRLDRNFGISTTPPPSERTPSDVTFESSGTIEIEDVKSASDAAKGATSSQQIQALLVGSRRLLESRHFDEARLQVVSALELDPDNVDAASLLAELDAADVAMQERRSEAAGAVHQAISDERFDAAADLLKRAIEELGSATLFDQVRTEIDAAIKERSERIRKAGELGSKAAGLSADGKHAEAVAALRDAIALDPSSDPLAHALAEAERRLEAAKEEERRAREIADTAAAIAASIQARDVDEAERALGLALKLYGEEQSFIDLRSDLEALEARILDDEIASLHNAARQLMEAREFDAAIGELDRAEALAPGRQETADLLAGAREGLRLEEEAKKRKLAIDRAALGVARLVLAGRLESAYRAIDTAVFEFGDFDEATELREQVAQEISTNTEIEERVGRAVERVRKLAREEKFHEAEDTLDEARRAAGDHPEAIEQVNETQAEVKALVDEHRRALAIAKARESIEAHVRNDALDEARRELRVAERLYGSDVDAIQELAEMIEKRQQALREAERDEEIERLLGSALRKDRPFEDIIKDLEAALALDADNEKVLTILEETREARARYEQEQRGQKIDQVMQRIDELISAGKIDEALAALDAARKEIGDFKEARALRRRLDRISRNGSLPV